MYTLYMYVSMLFIGFSPPLDKWRDQNSTKQSRLCGRGNCSKPVPGCFENPGEWPWRETGTKSFRRRCLFNERTPWFLIFKVDDFWNFLWFEFAAFTFTQKPDISDITLGFNRTLRYFTQPIRSPKKGLSNLPELLGCIPVGGLHDSLMIEWVSLAFCCLPPLEKPFPVVFFHAYHRPRSPLLNWRGSWVCSARRGAPRCENTTNPPVFELPSP